MWMNKYLCRVGKEAPIISSSTWVVDLRVYRNSPDAPPATIMFQMKGLYALSMITRRVLMQEDWESLRRDRLERQGLGYCTRDAPYSAFRIPLTCFPQIHEIFDRTTLPPGPPVILTPVLRYIPIVGSFTSSLSFSAGYATEEWYSKVLDFKLAMKIVVTLYDDWYWSQRSKWVSPAIIN